MQSVRRRRGFSLVEVLVVVGVLSILLALLLPALLQARETARKLECQTRLHQIGLALHGYHDTHRVFPAGLTPPPVVPANDAFGIKWQDMYASYGWGVRILPYLEQRALYEQLDIGRRPLEQLVDEEPQFRGLVETRLEIFRCPVDLADDTMETSPVHPQWRRLNRGPDSAPTKAERIYGGSSSYVGNCGFYEPMFPIGPPPRKQNNGILYTGSSVQMRDVTDGATNTIMVGERAWFQGSATWVGTSNVMERFGGGPGSCLGRVFWPINSLPDPPAILITPDSGLQILGDYNARTAFGSYHLAGANFLFVDGSVHFLSENIDSHVTVEAKVGPAKPLPEIEQIGTFQRLGIRDDGLVVGQY